MLNFDKNFFTSFSSLPLFPSLLPPSLPPSLPSSLPPSLPPFPPLPPSLPLSLPPPSLPLPLPYLALPVSPEVYRTSPDASTTCKLITFSLIVPYLTALVPEALVAAIPHNEASAPGSVLGEEETKRQKEIKHYCILLFLYSLGVHSSMSSLICYSFA